MERININDETILDDSLYLPEDTPDSTGSYKINGTNSLSLRSYQMPVKK